MSGPDSVIDNVIALRRPAEEGQAAPGALAPAEAAAWTEWLAANTPSPWRPGEWDANTRLFTGDVDNRSTMAYRCTVAACDRISRTQVLCDLCEKAFAKSKLTVEEFRATFVPNRSLEDGKWEVGEQAVAAAAIPLGVVSGWPDEGIRHVDLPCQHGADRFGHPARAQGGDVEGAGAESGEVPEFAPSGCR